MKKKKNKTTHKRITLDIDLLVRFLPFPMMGFGGPGGDIPPIDPFRDIEFRIKPDREKSMADYDDLYRSNFDDSVPIDFGTFVFEQEEE
tara:strand:+ start:322 stop:588 length:267 start_codon:yes stop_codon:yes gene_type:complete